MSGGVAQGATKTKISLPAVQELPGHQKASEAQVKATKKPARWSTFGKFKVDTKKTQQTSDTGGTIRRQRKHRTKPRVTDPYNTRNQELKMEESKRAQRKVFNWKRRQQQKLEKNTEVLDVSEFLRKMFLKKPRFKKGKSMRRNKSLPRQ